MGSAQMASTSTWPSPRDPREHDDHDGQDDHDE